MYSCPKLWHQQCTDHKEGKNYIISSPQTQATKSIIKYVKDSGFQLHPPLLTLENGTSDLHINMLRCINPNGWDKLHQQRSDW